MAFMDYQKPQSSGADINTNFFLDLQNLKNAKQQGDLNALRVKQAEQQIDRENKYNALAEQYFNAPDKAETTLNPDGSGETVTKQSKGDIFRQMLVLDPQKAKSIYDVTSKMSDDQYIQSQREAETIGRLGFQVAQNPELLDQMFPTLPKNVQAQIVQMGYNPAQPNAAINKKIGEHYAQIGVDLKTLTEHAFKSKESQIERDFKATEGEKDRNSAFQRTKYSADSSFAAAKYSADTQKDLYEKGLKGNVAVNNPENMSLKEQESERKRLVTLIRETTDMKKRQEYLDRLEQLGGKSGGETKSNSPYAEGTMLRGKDGKIYRVVNGVPVAQ